MQALRDALDRVHPHFAKGGKLQKLYPVYEALDTFLYTPGETTKGLTHVRDSIDLKRMMITVVVALIPCTLFGMWNVGYQANTAIAEMAAVDAPFEFDWHHTVQAALGLGHDPTNFIDNFVYGAIYFLPLYIVTMVVGGHIEMVFSILRGHEINEGFLVTGLLYPLILPPDIPLWQVALGIAFGVIVGKEIFGGTGRNFLNPALTARAFLYFAYSAQISGDQIWTAVDGFAGATPLGVMAVADPAVGMDALSSVAVPWGERAVTLSSAFFGTIQGCVGETSVLMCLIGAAILIVTGVGSWRIMSAVVVGVIATTLLLNAVGSDTNAMFTMPFHWHLAVGGLAFGIVFMATDPVSASMTNTGKWIYGILIGFMTILIRVVNPAFPEGVMLAILFGNVFAPLIDYFVIQSNIRRRVARYVPA
ncbi:NADH:ubiquinone reductase (Na(+)-transporting) subunit B [Candidatus Laterigemmans baculatus]|uniref:NADH:ubiquinone reductase (Na(+)-transporting) subunit B n=1 Tax=Candidatus Laterigemmans baculatus TaxID=2770505 RepID=UPI0013DBCF90|nr:NADH:ubiquinone reductase (Na(+)-transporting) subunit B [Candidatus Laterigemmans baculatus]